MFSRILARRFKYLQCQYCFQSTPQLSRLAKSHRPATLFLLQSYVDSNVSNLQLFHSSRLLPTANHDTGSRVSEEDFLSNFGGDTEAERTVYESSAKHRKLAPSKGTRKGSLTIARDPKDGNTTVSMLNEDDFQTLSVLSVEKLEDSPNINNSIVGSRQKSSILPNGSASTYPGVYTHSNDEISGSEEQKSSVRSAPEAEERAMSAKERHMPVEFVKEKSKNSASARRREVAKALEDKIGGPRKWKKYGKHEGAEQKLGLDALGRPASALILRFRGEPAPAIQPKNESIKKQAKKLKADTESGGKGLTTSTENISKSADKPAQADAQTWIAQDKSRQETCTNTETEKQTSLHNSPAGTRSQQEAFSTTITDALVSPASGPKDVTLSIQAMATASQDELTEAELVKHIEEFRPPSRTELKLKEFTTLVNKIMKSFTRAQIETYIKAFSKINPDETEPPPWIVSFPQYTPDMKRIAKTAASSRKAPSSLPKKEAVVVHTLIDLWGLSVAGKVDGYMDIRLRDVEFGLLVAGNQRALNFMARFYLAGGGRIEAFPMTNTIRIIASRLTAEKILHEINSLLSDTSNGTIMLKGLPKLSSFGKIIDQLAKLTDSLIKHDAKYNKLTVHWINLSQRSKDFETMCETVYRLLMMSFYRWSGSTSRLILGENLHANKRFVESGHDRGKWPWHRRLGRWVRLVYPVPIGTQATPPPPDIPALLVKDWDLKSENIIANHKYDPDCFTTSGWSKIPKTTTKVTFGYILYPKTSGIQPDPELGYDTNPQARMLSPITPPIQSLITLPDSSSFSSDCLLLKFLPKGPITGQPRVLGDAPPLELKVALGITEENRENKGEKTILGPISLRALLADHTTDIVFPSACVDARVFQDRYVDLDPKQLEANIDLQSFLSKCSFNLERGQLATPAKAIFSIPGRLFIDRRKQVSDGMPYLDESRIRVTSMHEDALIKTEYTFMSIEIQREVLSMWKEGTYITFTSKEGGKGGGNRAEFGLWLVATPDQRGLEIVKENFISQIFEIVQGRTIPWQAFPETLEVNKNRGPSFTDFSE